MAKRTALVVTILALVASSLAFAGGNRDYHWQLTPTGSTARLRGVSAVSERVAWASGSLGTVLRTVDRGATWESVGPPGTQTLQFRDIEAFDRDTAVILSIGTGTDSRIYRTTDAGRTWTLVFQNTDPLAFYDCMAFFDRHRGLALSDPVGGRFRILATSDGGQTWHVVAADMPPALPLEFAFAASGQCITTAGGRDAWFATGGDATARVFHSEDRGQTWTVVETPIRSGPSAGIFALAFRDPRHGIAAGGDFLAPTASPDALAVTRDGGETWSLVPTAPDEYRSGAHWVTGRDAIVVGPSGSDVTTDAGRTWHRFDEGSFDTVDCAGGHACWASGEQGRVAYLTRD
ncbi:MAG: oxidoreductase [Actinomycetota bacterium]|nr:oxidoreductase [Actinomycetota bacterium]